MTALIALLLAAGHPCLEDARKLCAGIRPGQGRIAACLKSHESEISAACKAKRAAFREEADSCEADVQKLCPDTKPGRERHDCMMQHKDQVSAECKEFFGKRMERREERREGRREAMEACREDAQRLCKEVKKGHGAVLECLRQHDKDISPACAAELQSGQH
jgi:hypothetical protein